MRGAEIVVIGNAFSEQFERENHYEHILLKDVFYYHDEDKALYQAEIDVFGHCLITDVFEYGKVIYRIRHVALETNELMYIIHPDSNSAKRSIVRFGDDESFYVMSTIQGLQLDTYYQALNQQFIEQKIAFRDEINNAMNVLFQDENNVRLVYNFIDNVSLTMFLNIKLIAGVESFLYDRNELGEACLLSDRALRRSLISKRIEVVNSIESKEFITMENNDEIKLYMDNHLDIFSKIIQRKYDFKNVSCAVYTAYRMVLTVSRQFFSEKWNNEYGGYFPDINNISLREATVRYCCINDINPRSLLSSGTFIYFLMTSRKFEDNNNYISCCNYFIDILNEALEDKKILDYERNLIKSGRRDDSYSINSIDLMSGTEFENFIGLLFAKLGYSIHVTKGSGDQGIDVIAEKNGRRFGIQVKCYASSVTNKAIQEVVAGIKHYSLEKGIVVTNNYFTESAKELAESNNVILWDRNMLKEKIAEVF